MTELSRLLADEVHETRLAANWEGAKARVGARGRRRALAMGGVVALALGLLLWPSDPEVLRLADGAAIPDVTADETRELAFEEGSRIVLEPGAAIATKTNRRGLVAFHQERGRAEYRITPGGPRRWIVDAGIARVEVLGTVFVVDRSDDAVVVTVQRGRVRVTGDEGAHILGAGEMVRLGAPVPVPLEEAPAEVAVLEQSSALGSPSSIAQLEGEAPSEARLEEEAPSEEAPPEEAEEAQLEEASPDEAPAEETLASTGVRELMRQADELRAAGRPREAIPMLRRILEQHAEDPQATLAAVVLGRLHMRLGDRSEAREVLLWARDTGVPRALSEDVERRLSELEPEDAR